MRTYNRPSHYQTSKKPKQRSTTFYLERRLLKLLKEIAEFENISLSIMVERSLNYARSGNFKRANKLKKKTKIYAKNKRKFANYKAKQKDEAYQKCLFN
ncbi:hypothetical protein CUPS4256_08695 [Campylobacter upsaliensis]|uniref:hypothetical protein n=1 Tax=Campylobacter upsaliensis TaxID=28080 RepID=UPI002149BEAF|nr:hypothetical protein [Campylobacter upsaliensis]MCR2103318.1 hypothetical protein [Campylobacter upsaliensis]MCR2105184.1 hypothetical protein [Campylobacter upsaliensis]